MAMTACRGRSLPVPASGLGLVAGTRERPHVTCAQVCTVPSDHPVDPALAHGSLSSSSTLEKMRKLRRRNVKTPAHGPTGLGLAGFSDKRTGSPGRLEFGTSDEDYVFGVSASPNAVRDILIAKQHLLFIETPLCCSRQPYAAAGGLDPGPSPAVRLWAHSSLEAWRYAGAAGESALRVHSRGPWGQSAGSSGNESP